MKRIARSPRGVLLAFLLITFAALVIWLCALSGVWMIARRLEIESDYWAMLEALSAAVAASAVFGAGFVAYRELSEVVQTRYMAAADKLFEQLNSDESVAARRWVFQHLPAEPAKGIAQLPPEGRAAIKHVLNSLDRVAFLTQAGWVPEELVMPWMHPMIAKSWEKLEPYILYEQKRRNEPYYYEMVERLAQRCRVWRERNLVDSSVRWVVDAL